MSGAMSEPRKRRRADEADEDAEGERAKRSRVDADESETASTRMALAPSGTQSPPSTVRRATSRKRRGAAPATAPKERKRVTRKTLRPSTPLGTSASTSASASAATAAQVPSAVSPKRRRNRADIEDIVKPVGRARGETPPLPCYVRRVDLERQVIWISNPSGVAQDLSGFSIQTAFGEDGEAAQEVFPIPKGVVLPPGGYVELWCAPGMLTGSETKALQRRRKTVLFWHTLKNQPRRKAVLRRGIEKVVLADKRGATVAECSYEDDEGTFRIRAELPPYVAYADLAREAVVISNPSSRPVDLSGFVLKDKDGRNEYKFPAKTTAKANGDVILFCAPGKLPEEDQMRAKRAGILFWTNRDGSPRSKEVLNNSGEILHLMDPAGVEIASLAVSSDQAQDIRVATDVWGDLPGLSTTDSVVGPRHAPAFASPAAISSAPRVPSRVPSSSSRTKEEDAGGMIPAGAATGDTFHVKTKQVFPEAGNFPSLVQIARNVSGSTYSFLRQQPAKITQMVRSVSDEARNLVSTAGAMLSPKKEPPTDGEEEVKQPAQNGELSAGAAEEVKADGGDDAPPHGRTTSLFHQVSQVSDFCARQLASAESRVFGGNDGRLPLMLRFLLLLQAAFSAALLLLGQAVGLFLVNVLVFSAGCLYIGLASAEKVKSLSSFPSRASLGSLGRDLSGALGTSKASLALGAAWLWNLASTSLADSRLLLVRAATRVSSRVNSLEIHLFDDLSERVVHGAKAMTRFAVKALESASAKMRAVAPAARDAWETFREGPLVSSFLGWLGHPMAATSTAAARLWASLEPSVRRVRSSLAQSVGRTSEALSLGYAYARSKATRLRVSPLLVVLVVAIVAAIALLSSASLGTGSPPRSANGAGLSLQELSSGAQERAAGMVSTVRKRLGGLSDALLLPLPGLALPFFAAKSAFGRSNASAVKQDAAPLAPSSESVDGEGIGALALSFPPLFWALQLYSAAADSIGSDILYAVGSAARQRLGLVWTQITWAFKQAVGPRRFEERRPLGEDLALQKRIRTAAVRDAEMLLLASHLLRKEPGEVSQALEQIAHLRDELQEYPKSRAQFEEELLTAYNKMQGVVRSVQSPDLKPPETGFVERMLLLERKTAGLQDDVDGLDVALGSLHDAVDDVIHDAKGAGDGKGLAKHEEAKDAHEARGALKRALEMIRQIIAHLRRLERAPRLKPQADELQDDMREDLLAVLGLLAAEGQTPSLGSDFLRVLSDQLTPPVLQDGADRAGAIAASGTAEIAARTKRALASFYVERRLPLPPMLAKAAGAVPRSLLSGVSLASATYAPSALSSLSSFLSVLVPPEQGPETVLGSRTGPFTRLGDCWAMAGNSGFISFRVRKAQIPKRQLNVPLLLALSVEYAPELIRYANDSAPRELRLWGTVAGSEFLMRPLRRQHPSWLAREDAPDEEPELFQSVVEYRVDPRYPALQTWVFEVPDEAGVFDTVKMEVVNNWGNHEFTAIYRVHLTTVE